MGQVMDKFHGKQWREKQMRKITDKVYDRFKQQQTASGGLTFEDIYIAVLLVFNDMNKYLPGPHFDPPSRAEVKAAMEACDMNLDGELDREEFAKFIQQLTADTCVIVSQKLLITLVVAPTVAMATKKATEGVPGVGKVVQKLPASVFASLVTLAIVFFQQSGDGV
uniref:EF-hand domain-containing protein n=2 Tax=Kalanchoe fedtschenkoi TaxID=63787 RepID=A0A7N0UJ18_KALFE